MMRVNILTAAVIAVAQEAANMNTALIPIAGFSALITDP